MQTFQEIGTILRSERESRKLRIEDVAKSLKIRASYLTAMEEGRIKELPGAIYSLGYLKIYSDFLLLESAEIVQSFRNLAESEFFSGGMVLHGDPYSHELKPTAGIVFISLLMVVILYFFWYEAIYSPGFDSRKYSAVREKALIEKAKALYGTENQ